MFENLRRLGQGKKSPRIHTARNEIVSGTLGGAFRQKRGFDLNKSVAVKEVACCRGDAAPQNQVSLNFGPSQIEIAELQADIFGNIRHLVEDKRRGFRLVHDLQFIGHHLHISGSKIRILHSLGAAADTTVDGQDEFIADSSGFSMAVRVDIRIENDLYQSLPITKVDEDHPAVIPPAIDPAH